MLNYDFSQMLLALLAYLGFEREYHIIAIAPAVPFVGELHGLGFAFIVRRSRHQRVMARPPRLPVILPTGPRVARWWMNYVHR